MNSNITAFNRQSNICPRIYTPGNIAFTEYTDGSAFYTEPPGFTDDDLMDECKYTTYKVDLKAAMIGQRVYGKEKMKEVYAAMKQIKSGALNADDFKNERKGWYICFKRADFDMEKCLEIMKGFHQQYLDIDRVNRSIETQLRPIVFMPQTYASFQPAHPFYYNNSNNNNNNGTNNNNNNITLEEVLPPPRKKNKADPKPELYLTYHSTKILLTKENAALNLNVYRNGVFGIIDNIAKGTNGKQDRIAIKWDNGIYENVVYSTDYFRNIYLATIEQIQM